MLYIIYIYIVQHTGTMGIGHRLSLTSNIVHHYISDYYLCYYIIIYVIIFSTIKLYFFLYFICLMA